MIDYKVNLKIADTVILMQSCFPLEQFSAEGQKLEAAERFDNFFYKGSQRPDIVIDIEIADKLPDVLNTKPVFITYHFQDKNENWRLLKRGDIYIYKCPLEDKKQIMLVNKTFDRVKVYLLPKKNKGKVWNTSDIIYDFLQVLLINYFAQRNQGIFTHSVGIKDVGGRGLLFAGKSGAGKSTTARLWHKHSRATVLNDDRIIIRKFNGKFFIYGSPWHGEFSDYLASRIESAPLKRIFFIHHCPKNTITRIPPKQAFSLLYPALFPTFWDKDCLENIVAFCDDLVKNVSCYSLGFMNNEKVINFVRRCKDGKKNQI
ncbi:MAG: hypothetical protein PHG87_06175 [Candidatus Omnitrophica bacterium]|nr:hypothetical protein [Candidatus Omnitrophota bacterium]